MKNKNIFPKVFSREFPLILLELWGDRYKKMFGKKIKSLPAQVFIIKNGIVDTYRNMKAVEEINSILLSERIKNKKLADKLYTENLSLFKKLEKDFKKNHLSKKEFRRFYKDFFDLWTGIYFGFHIPRDKQFTEDMRRAAYKLREKIDSAPYKATSLINRTVNHHKKLGDKSSYVLKKELNGGFEDKIIKRASQTVYMVDSKLVSKNEFEKIKSIYNFVLEDAGVSGAKFLNHAKGSPAFSGKVNGHVKIVVKRSDAGAVKKGDILVSSMTNPDYLPAMKLAAAFVTDEGGITCHAAIIAREMKKPCIIGTKIATQIFKDGDMVEVDATKGIVRKI